MNDKSLKGFGGTCVAHSDMLELKASVIACEKCPRLVKFRTAVPVRAAFRGQEYWRRPVPGFGDVQARIAIVGLAPATHGGSRTGRVFTGDESARFLMRSLYEVGLANKPESASTDDGLTIAGCYMTAAVKCLPPGDRPTPKEFLNCSAYLDEEPELLTEVEAIVALGALAFGAVLRWAAEEGTEVPRVKFRHGQLCRFEGLPAIYACYHPSPRNTYTSKLTRRMMTGLFRRVIKDLTTSSRSGAR